MTIVVIGGGAAGFFAANAAARRTPEAKVIILERSSKVLAKVKVSGGGRCNVTNATFNNRELAAHYPRGENFLKKAFEQFNAQSTVDWFETRGVRLRTYPDNCIFPQSNDSQTIIDCFMHESAELGVEVRTGVHVETLRQEQNGFCIICKGEQLYADKVIVTIGGQPKRSGMSWLEDLGINIVEPVPSLFTFNMPNDPVRELMGNVVERTTVRVEGTRLVGRGPLLITHWGMSGPAVLQLSAWGARILADSQYSFTILVNWLDQEKEDSLRAMLERVRKEHPGKKMVNLNPFPISNRLWAYLLEKSGCSEELRWGEPGKKNVNRLVNTLLNDRYEVRGKTTFKEEFVTAGGVALSEVDVRTMECKKVPGLYFAGEVLDIDGITGGFNFQAAWTTGYIAGKSAATNP